MAFRLFAERYLDASNQWLVPHIRALKNYDFETAVKWYATVGPALYRRPQDVALLGANDRFFLLAELLGRKDTINHWLYYRSREVELDADGYLDLWAREHYKSTIITFAGSIQEVLRDPEMTIGIFSHTKGIATDFLRQIMAEFANNDVLKWAYEDVLWSNPRKQAPYWSLDGGIIVKRKSNPKERTIEAWGLIDGQPTGRHFGLRIYDDVVTRESVTNPDMIKKTTEAWELSDNLGAGEGRMWHIGTRYSFADTYGVIFERDILKPRIYPATDNGRLDGEPVFISKARWEMKKNLQRSQVAAQMLQNPIAGNENMFRTEWLRQWYVRPSILNVYIMGDPSKGKKDGNDNTAIAVIGIDVHANKYFLDGFRHRLSLSDRWKALKMLHQKWSKVPGVQMVRVGWERYGVQADDEYFQERMREERYPFEIVELAWPREGGHSKKDRVGRLEPDVRLGRFFLPGVIKEPGRGDQLWTVDLERSHLEFTPLDWNRPPKDMGAMIKSGRKHLVAQAVARIDQDRRMYDLTRKLIEELQFFPFAPRDDLIDAASRIYDMEALPPAHREDADARQTYDFDYEDA
jgi:hypothetical protein